MIMPKQHLSNIWSSFYEKNKQHSKVELKKALLIKKQVTLMESFVEE